MPRDGAGNYNLPSGNPVVSGTIISSTTQNSTMTDVGSALTSSIAKDGQTTPTANLTMGNFRHTNVAAAAARTDYAQAGQVQDSAMTYLTSVSGTDTIAASAITPSGLAAYAAGQVFRFISAGTNLTSAVTLNINGIGAKNVTQLGAFALQPGMIQAGAIVTVTYDGTQFQATGINTGASIVGLSRWPRIIVTAASTSLTFTADEVVVETALAGTRFTVSSVNVSINTATTGAGGMDTGSAPLNGAVCLYLIYNPTTGAVALLGKNGPTLQPNIYGGANMPAGYTASALVGVWTTNGSGQFVTGYMRDRTVMQTDATVLSSTTVQGSLTTLALANNVAPANAIAVYGNVTASPVTAGALAIISLFSSLQNAGAVRFNVAGVNNLGQGGPYRLPLAVTQSLYYTSALSAGTFQYQISVTGFDF